MARPDSLLRGSRWVFSFLVVLAWAAAACSTGTVPTTETAGAPELLEQGAELYAASCAACHGADLRGTEQGPSHLSVVYEPNHHSDFSFISAAQNGVQPHHWNFGPMPPIKGLTDDELTAIVAFVRDTQSREGFEPYPPPG